MKKRVLLSVCVPLLLMSWPVAGQDPAPKPSTHAPKIPALLKLGDTGDRVLELQATLNAKLLDPKSDNVFTLPNVAETEDTRNREVQILKFERSNIGPTIVVQVDAETLTLNLSGKRWELNKEKTHLALKPGQTPLKVDGIYGPQTFAAVLLFQKDQDLFPTGEVDAVTLDRLEPLVPPNYMLAKLMEYPSKLYAIEPEAYPWRVKQTTSLLMFLILLALSTIVHLVARTFARSTEFLSRWIFTPTTSPWFNTLKENKFFSRMAHLAPAIFLYLAAAVYPYPNESGLDPFPYLDTYEKWHIFVSRLGMAYVALVITRVILAYLDTCEIIFSNEQPKDNPIEGIIRAGRRLITVIGLVLIVAAFAGKNPMLLVGGLGAITAVVMLVFKDAILGFVASVQIVAHNMVEVGDWIEMPKYEVDGNVVSISLTTIKVHNFDKTITCIPTYGVISESFKNWRGIQEAGGRRIKRSIFIDMNTIKSLDLSLVKRFERISLLKDYLIEKREALKQHFAVHDVILSPLNGRWLTNIGTFRIYLEKYLSQHPQINHDLTCLVRQLQPTREGLPIEIYAFSKDTEMGTYENLQADIFDHIISILPEFDLRIFQDPSEYDYHQAEDLYAHRIDHQATLGLVGDLKGEELTTLREMVDEQNDYLASHPRARVETAAAKIDAEIERLKLSHRIGAVTEDRTIHLRNI